MAEAARTAAMPRPAASTGSAGSCTTREQRMANTATTPQW